MTAQRVNAEGPLEAEAPEGSKSSEAIGWRDVALRGRV